MRKDTLRIHTGRCALPALIDACQLIVDVVGVVDANAADLHL